MRVQLNFRDTHINYDNGIYTLNFNISKYVKLQQLSNNARCYIESVNLLDVSPAGITHRLEGSFDIHANFINNDDISSSENVYEPVIFSHILYNTSHYQNSNGMHNLNYKVNENQFKSGNLQLKLVFYKTDGTIYKNGSFVDINSSFYSAYTSQLTIAGAASKLVVDKTDDVEKIKTKLQTLNNSLTNFQINTYGLETSMYDLLDDLQKEVTSKVSKATSTRSVAFWNDYLIEIKKYILRSNDHQIHLIYNFEYPYTTGGNLLPTKNFENDFANPFKSMYETYFNEYNETKIIEQNIEKIEKGIDTAIIELEATKIGVSNPSILYSNTVREQLYTANKKGEVTSFQIKLLINDNATNTNVTYISDNSNINFIVNDIIEIKDVDLRNYKAENNSTDTNIPNLELKVTKIVTKDEILSVNKSQLKTFKNLESNELVTLNDRLKDITTITNDEKFIQDGVRGMSMNIILYDEIDEFKSNGSIHNNHNINRNTNCVFRRI